MLSLLSQASLVVLAGVYAMRTGPALLGREGRHPLVLLAALALVFSTAVFHRLPTAPGAWTNSVAVLCLLGVAVNTLLLVKPDAAHSQSVDLAFSATSVGGWALVGAHALSVA
jgi:hypothetical protein